jgi:hypothetical protein
MADCPYIGKCRSEIINCNTCKHNKYAKRDYYEPVDSNPNYCNPYRHPCDVITICQSDSSDLVIN